MFPITSLAERAADSLRGVAEKIDHWHAAKEATLEEDKIRVEMADHGALDLREFGADFRNLRDVRQRGGIVAKQNCALGGREVGEGATDFFDVSPEEHVPLVGFIFEQLTLEHRQSKERGGDADQHVVVEGERPEWFQGEHVSRTAEAFEAQAADIRAEGLFAEFVIADDGVEAVAELRAEFGETFGRALERWIVGQTDEAGVARVIAVGDNEVGVSGGVDEHVEEIVVGEGIALPEEVAIESDEETDARTGDGAVTVVDAGPFGSAGVVDVAEDKNAHGNKRSPSP